MKVTPEHLQEIREGIALILAHVEKENGLDEAALRAKYLARDIPRGDLVQDIDKRFRWDLYWGASRLTGGLPDSTSGYNDAHIDTALRAVVRPLEGA